MRDHSFTLHELARLRDKPGEPLLIVEPVEPQPTQYVTEPQRRMMGAECRHGPGDVLVQAACLETLYSSRICERGTVACNVCHSLRLTVERVECKQVQDVAVAEMRMAGFDTHWTAGADGIVRNQFEGWWNETHAARPELIWERNPWVWCTWTQAAEVEGGDDD